MKTSIKIIKLLFLILIFYYLYDNKFFNFDFFKSFLEVKKLLLITILGFLTVILNSFRWWLILKTQDIKIKIINVFKLVYMGSFFNNILLGAYGGDIFRIYHISKFTKKDKLKISLTVLLDRIYGLIGLILLGDIVFLFVSIDNGYVNYFYLFNLLIIFLLALFILITKQIVFLKKKFSFVLNYFNINLKSFIYCILLSIILFVLVHLCVYIISVELFNIKIKLSTVFFSNTLASLASIIPLTPGGVGIAEFAFVKINQDLFNIYIENLANIIIFFRLSNILTTIPSLFFFISYKNENN